MRRSSSVEAWASLSTTVRAAAAAVEARSQSRSAAWAVSSAWARSTGGRAGRRDQLGVDQRGLRLGDRPIVGLDAIGQIGLRGLVERCVLGLGEVVEAPTSGLGPRRGDGGVALLAGPFEGQVGLDRVGDGLTAGQQGVRAGRERHEAVPWPR